jgi:glycosyltransferase involved in cell wall biosynthesis
MLISQGTTIGVIIPTFNRVEETIRAVDSVLKQSVPVNQIIVVDDGSTIENLARLRAELISKPVEIFEMSHTGHPGIAREYGRKQVSTEWVAFLDSDDIWSRNKIEKFIEYQLQFSADALCSSSVGLQILGLSGQGSRYLSKREVFKSNKIINSSVIVRAALLESTGGIATSYSVRGCEDYATWLRVTDLANWFYIDEELVHYADNSVDSIRKDEEFSQDFSAILALLDYALYSRNKRGRGLIRLRLLLKHLWRIVI